MNETKTIEFRTKNPKQIQAARYWIDKTTEQLLYGGAKGGGKSYLLVALIFGDALIYPQTHYFIARLELNDLRKYTIPTIHEVFKNWDIRLDDYMAFNGQDNIYNLRNGSKVFLISCKEIPSDPLYERFGSMQMTRGAIEEAGEVAEAAKANLWLSIGRWKNDKYGLKKKLLLTANPKKGWMKREFVDPFKQNLLPPAKQYIQALATDNPYNSPDYITSLYSEKDKVRRQRLAEGNWDYDEDLDSLVSFDALTDAFTNTITKTDERYLLIDVARLGQDSTVFAIWEGLELITLHRYTRQDTQKTMQQAKDFAAQYQIPYSNILIDEDGIGGAVVDGMFGVRGFVANSTPLQTASQIRGRLSQVESPLTPRTNFKNLKAQCAFKLSELINEHKIAFKALEYRNEIIEELTALLRRKDIDSDGKMQIKPKEDVKADLGHSPDIGDTIIFRAWFELRNDLINEDPHMGRVIQTQATQFSRNRANSFANSNK